MKKWIAMLTAAVMSLLAGCGIKPHIMDGPGMMDGYRQITQEQAKAMMEKNDGHLIVDVRRPDEYAAGHIPGAINVPNEEIGETPPAALQDRFQILLVYCRSGRRSKEAAQKLHDLGYTQVYEFGGILDWTGETETLNETDAIRPMPILTLEINGVQFTADAAQNAAAEALIEKLSAGPLELTLHDYGGFEKVGALPWELPADDTTVTTKPGDLILYNGDQITIYYDENTWELTKLGEIHISSEEAFRAALGEGDAAVKFWVEWTE